MRSRTALHLYLAGRTFDPDLIQNMCWPLKNSNAPIRGRLKARSALPVRSWVRTLEGGTFIALDLPERGRRQVPCVSACCATYNQNSATLALSAGSAQSPLQPVLLLRPTGILCLRFLFESIPLGLDCRHSYGAPFHSFPTLLAPWQLPDCVAGAVSPWRPLPSGADFHAVAAPSRTQVRPCGLPCRRSSAALAPSLSQGSSLVCAWAHHQPSPSAGRHAR